MATPIKNLKCFIDNHGNRVLTWQIAPHIPYNIDAQITVLYSQTGDDWLKISPDVKNYFYWVDTVKTTYGKVNTDYYRLKYTLGNQQYVTMGIPAGFRLPKRLYAILKNMFRLTYKLFKLTGRNGMLLKKKTYGMPCPACKHFDDDVSVNLHCPLCFGTGIQGGYYDGIPMPIMPDGLQQLFAMQLLGFSQGRTLQAKFPAWAYIEMGDVWVDDYTDQRYQIDQVQISAAFKHIPTIYTVTMHLVENTDAIHDIGMDLKLLPLVTGPAWMLQFKVL